MLVWGQISPVPASRNRSTPFVIVRCFCLVINLYDDHSPDGFSAFSSSYSLRSSAQPWVKMIECKYSIAVDFHFIPSIDDFLKRYWKWSKEIAVHVEDYYTYDVCPSLILRNTSIHFYVLSWSTVQQNKSASFLRKISTLLAFCWQSPLKFE